MLPLQGAWYVGLTLTQSNALGNMYGIVKYTPCKGNTYILYY